MVLKVQNMETRRCVFAQIILITNSKWIFLTLGLILIGFRENHMQYNAYFEINRFLGKSDKKILTFQLLETIIYPSPKSFKINWSKYNKS